MKTTKWKIACALWLIVFFLLGIAVIRCQDTNPDLALFFGLAALGEGGLGLFILGINSGYPYGNQ